MLSRTANVIWSYGSHQDDAITRLVLTSKQLCINDTGNRPNQVARLFNVRLPLLIKPIVHFYLGMSTDKLAHQFALVQQGECRYAAHIELISQFAILVHVDLGGHGGDIELETREERGLRAVMRLPKPAQD